MATLGLNKAASLRKCVPHIGYQMTTARQRTAKRLRSRDMLEERLEFVPSWSGKLQVSMRLQESVMRLGMGQKNGSLPCSLVKFAQLLGRTKVGVISGKPEYHSTHRFLMLVYDALIVCCAMQVLKVKTIKNLQSALSENGWKDVVDKVVSTYLLPQKFHVMRKLASKKATATYASKCKRIKEQGPADGLEEVIRSMSARTSTLKRLTEDERDIPHENMLLLMHDLRLYEWHYRSIKHGNTESLGIIKEIMKPFFHGVKNYN